MLSKRNIEGAWLLVGIVLQAEHHGAGTNAARAGGSAPEGSCTTLDECRGSKSQDNDQEVTTEVHEYCIVGAG